MSKHEIFKSEDSFKCGACGKVHEAGTRALVDKGKLQGAECFFTAIGVSKPNTYSKVGSGQKSREGGEGTKASNVGGDVSRFSPKEKNIEAPLPQILSEADIQKFIHKARRDVAFVFQIKPEHVTYDNALLASVMSSYIQMQSQQFSIAMSKLIQANKRFNMGLF